MTLLAESFDNLRVHCLVSAERVQNQRWGEGHGEL